VSAVAYFIVCMAVTTDTQSTTHLNFFELYSEACNVCNKRCTFVSNSMIYFKDFRDIRQTVVNVRYRFVLVSLRVSSITRVVDVCFAARTKLKRLNFS